MNKSVKTLLGIVLVTLLCSFAFTLGVFAATGLSFTTVIEKGSTIADSTYTFFVDGSTYYVKNGTTGELSSSSNASYIIQSIVTAEGNDEYSMHFKIGTWTLQVPVTWTGSPEVTIIGESFNILTGSVIRNSDQSEMFVFGAGATSFTGSIYMFNMAFHGNDKNCTIIKFGGNSQAGLIHFERSQFIGFGSNGTAIDTGTKAYACEDSYFDEIKISYGNVGIKFYKPTHTLVHCNFHYCDIGLELHGNTQVEMYGGVFSHNDYDISFDTANLGSDVYHNAIQFDGVWFEDSVEGIIKIPNNNATVANLIFESCRFHTDATDNLLNLTMPNSFVTLINNHVGSTSANMTVIRSATTHIESLHNTYESGVTFYAWYVTQNGGTSEASNDDWISHGLAGEPTMVQLTVEETDDSYFPQVKATNATHFQIYLYDDAGAAENTDKTINWYAEYKP